MAWLFAVLGYCRLRRPSCGEVEAADPNGKPTLSLLRAHVLSSTPTDVLEGLSRVLEPAGRSDTSPALAVKPTGEGQLLVTNLGHPGLVQVPAFSRCHIEVHPAANSGTEITMRADVTALRNRAAGLARILLGIGLAVLAGACLLCWQASTNHTKLTGLAQPLLFALFVSLPAPWAVYALYRRACRGTEMFMDSTIANAAAMAEAFARKRVRNSKPD